MGRYRVSKRQYGFSVLELTVSLLVVALLLTTALSLLHHVIEQGRALDERLSQRAAVEDCLARIVEDLSEVGPDASLRVRHHSSGWQQTSRLTVEAEASADGKAAARQIDWVAAPRYQEQDLVLFRREQGPDESDRAVYVPLCENLHSFQVELLNESAEPNTDPNKPAEMIEIRIELYQFESRDPEAVFVARRTFCRNRL